MTRKEDKGEKEGRGREKGKDEEAQKKIWAVEKGSLEDSHGVWLRYT